MTRSAIPRLRCGIYTRVSTDAGLEQEFNSLDNQREAAEAYVRSQAHEGWRCLPARYDDGGFSGGSLERPALQRLLENIRAGLVDVVVVYKVDRLTRSLADFAKLVELFDEHAVSFVSVTQSFNTTSSMGQLTLNVLLSFAQFEREVTGERIRDKIAASKKKGIWMGGHVPLGYRVESGKLVVDEEEAATVRRIFERYLALGSLTPLLSELRQQGIVTKQRQLASGTVRGGIPFTRGPLGYLLKNRTDLGETVHRGQSYPGEHDAIIPRELFEAVQARLTPPDCSDARDDRSNCAKGKSEVITLPWSRPSSRRREIIRPSTSTPDDPRPIRADRRATLVRAIALGRRWLAEITAGEMAGPDAIALREGCSKRHVTITISLAFLSPTLVKAAVDSRLPRGTGLKNLTDPCLTWLQQHQALGI